MSLHRHHQQGYAHSNAYGYPNQTPLQLAPQYPYHVQQYSQPTYIVDASGFRRDYAARLSELMFNSRPIIQNLSIIAQDFVRFADIVVQCIEAHIRRVSSSLFHTICDENDNCNGICLRSESSIIIRLYNLSIQS